MENKKCEHEWGLTRDIVNGEYVVKNGIFRCRFVACKKEFEVEYSDQVKSWLSFILNMSEKTVGTEEEPMDKETKALWVLFLSLVASGKPYSKLKEMIGDNEIIMLNPCGETKGWRE